SEAHNKHRLPATASGSRAIDEMVHASAVKVENQPRGVTLRNSRQPQCLPDGSEEKEDAQTGCIAHVRRLSTRPAVPGCEERTAWPAPARPWRRDAPM